MPRRTPAPARGGARARANASRGRRAVADDAVREARHASLYIRRAMAVLDDERWHAMDVSDDFATRLLAYVKKLIARQAQRATLMNAFANKKQLSIRALQVVECVLDVDDDGERGTQARARRGVVGRHILTQTSLKKLLGAGGINVVQRAAFDLFLEEADDHADELIVMAAATSSEGVGTLDVAALELALSARDAWQRAGRREEVRT